MCDRIDQKLANFRCESCNNWWMIAEPPADKIVWYCPWCGLVQEEHEEIKT